MLSLLAILLIVLPAAALILVPFTLNSIAIKRHTSEAYACPSAKGLGANRWTRSAEEHFREIREAA